MCRVYVLLTPARSTEPEERSINSVRMTLCFIYIHSGRNTVNVRVCVCKCVRPCASGSLTLMFRQTNRRREEQRRQWTGRAFFGGQAGYCGCDEESITEMGQQGHPQTLHNDPNISITHLDHNQDTKGTRDLLTLRTKNADH